MLHCSTPCEDQTSHTAAEEREHTDGYTYWCGRTCVIAGETQGQELSK